MITPRMRKVKQHRLTFIGQKNPTAKNAVGKILYKFNVKEIRIDAVGLEGEHFNVCLNVGHLAD